MIIMCLKRTHLPYMMCSLLAKMSGVFRELVIYDADQCYPEYVVLYKRKYAKADPTSPLQTRPHATHLQEKCPLCCRILRRRSPRRGSAAFSCRCRFIGGQLAAADGDDASQEGTTLP